MRPISIQDTFQTLHEQLLAEVDKSCLRTNEICLALEAILDKEKALSDASKAAAKDKLDDSTREKLKELEEKLEKVPLNSIVAIAAFIFFLMKSE